MKIISLNIGKPKTSLYNNKEYISGIGKHRVKNVLLTKEQFVGDDVANPQFHGGPDRSVCFYPYEHYEQWEQEFDTSLMVPAFGENLTVNGMLEKDVCIGDIFQIGGAVVQITQGRIPCSTISKYNHIDPLLKRTIETCYTGYFARVLNEGVIMDNSEIVLIDKHPLQINVFHTMYTYFHSNDTDSIQQIIEVNELASDMKNKFIKKLKKNTQQ